MDAKKKGRKEVKVENVVDERKKSRRRQKGRERKERRDKNKIYIEKKSCR